MEIDIENMNDKALEFLLDIQRVNLEDRKKAVAETEAMIKRAEAELERRALDAYWAAHPELTRVAVGDKVTITEEFLALRDMRRFWSDVPIIKVSHIDPIDGTVRIEDATYAPAQVTVGSIPMPTVSRMRDAYLANKE